MRLPVAMGAALEIVGVGLGVAGPYLLKLVIGGLSDGGRSYGLVLFAALFVLTWAGGNIIATWRMVYSAKLIDCLTQHYTARVLRSSLPEAADGREGDSGRVMGLIERLPYSLMVVVDGLIWRAGPLVLQLLGSLWLLAGLIPLRYALIMGVVLIGYGGATWLGALRHQRLSGRANVSAASASQATSDVLRNARRVILNGTLEAEIGHIRDSIRHKAEANQMMMWSLVAMSVVQYGLVGLGLVCLLAMAVADVAAHNMTVGNFVLLQGYAFRLAMPLSGFGFVLSQAAVSIENIRDVLAFGGEEEAAISSFVRPAGAARIVLDGVNFSYGPGLPGLTDISVNLEPGSFNVIVGPNGSGKSTLAQIIAGSLRPSSGVVSINGQNLAEVPRPDRHQLVLYIPQFIGLFNRTLSANALYPPSQQTEADLATLLMEWRFHDAGREIDFGAIVGEQGERLSGGQIQKLELARIAGVKVQAVVLDESTSALDTNSEEAVIKTLRSRFGNETTLILITHRPGLAEQADQVLFMKGGRLVRQGRHEYLLEDSAAYRQLWNK
jgi:ABC-type multidrug transport system fused ATPase/permease subunit